MAEIKKNIITQGTSGMLGDMLVFRQLRGKTILSTKPTPSEKVSDKQQVQKDRFQQAVLYGKAATADPTQKAEYAKGVNDRLISPYVVALADFLNAPDILEIDLSSYKGAVGDTIAIVVTDDFKVAGVKVEIHNADGVLVEEGQALQQPNQIGWLYTTTIANESITGDRIVIKAYDMPGNEATKEQQA